MVMDFTHIRAVYRICHLAARRSWFIVQQGPHLGTNIAGGLRSFTIPCTCHVYFTYPKSRKAFCERDSKNSLKFSSF